MTYEDKFINGLDYRIGRQKKNVLEDPERLKKIHSKMSKLAIFDCPKPEEFSDEYDTDTIKSDQEFVDEQEKIFSQDKEAEMRILISEIFEGIIISQSEQAEWLGGNAIVTRASRLDDIKNKVDCVCEFPADSEDGESEFLALGIDVTFGTYVRTETDKKLSRIEKEVKSGSLASIKYFRDNSGIHRKIEAPRVVVGADPDTVRELIELWDKGDKQALAKHPFVCGMLLTMQYQIYYFYKIAVQYGREEIAEKYANALGKLNEIIESKQEFLLANQEEAFKDHVVQRIWEKVKPSESIVSDSE